MYGRRGADPGGAPRKSRGCFFSQVNFPVKNNFILLIFFKKPFFFFFLMWAILKVIIEFVTILLWFWVLDFWPPGICGILAPRPGIEAAPLALEDEVLTTGYQRSPPK